MSEKKSTSLSCLPLPTSQVHHMDCCDICGDVGVPETLYTCSQLYCMRIPTEEHTDDWQCEECELPLASCLTGELPRVSRLTNSVEVRNSKKLMYGSRGRSVAWEKMVATGKTKYISAKEAIMLSSGEKKALAFANNFSRPSKSRRTEIGVKILERTPSKPRTVPRGFSPKEGPASRHLAQPKLGNMENSERNRQKFKSLSEGLSAISSLRPSHAPTNKHMQEEQPREVQSPQAKARRLTKKNPSSAPSPLPGGTGRATVKQRTYNAENLNNNLLPGSDECSCSPALDALWKGNFSIQADRGHCRLNHQIQAHPPSKVRRKIYEFSKKMPQVLHLQLVPVKEFWINLFKDFLPDEKDIGLYFFPGAGERSEDYISLLESIRVKNLALRIQIADVELLVFTSKLLPVNRQYWQGKNFLWGVFHRLKQDSSVGLNNEGLVLSVRPSDGSEEADMDIDMMGGICVGRVDIPVNKREPLREKHGGFKRESVTSANKALSICSTDLVPPGFEEVYRLRALGGAVNQGCSSSFPAKVKSEYML
ncbi:hypothetical protein OROMI_003366 [Orobanche minor]